MARGFSAIFLVLILLLTSLSLVVLSINKGDPNTALTDEENPMEVIVPLAQANIAGFQEGSIYTNMTLSLGNKHTCAILDNGDLKCWGWNYHGQLGDGGSNTNVNAPSSTAIDLGTGRVTSAVSAANNYACAILDNGELKCWGENDNGQLGNGGNNQINSPSTTSVDLGTGRTAVAVSAGNDHNCAILDNGELKCWGEDRHGELGNGGPAWTVSNPTDTNAPSSTSINLGTSRTAVAVSAASEYTCAILDNGDLKCWGRDNYGQLGDGGSNTNTNAPSSTAIDLGTGRTAVSVSTGTYHTCAILDNGELMCWGKGQYGQLGDGGSNSNLNAPSSTAIDLGTGRTAIAVSAGDSHTCAILDNGDLKCWGRDYHGQLGDGGTNTDTNAPSSTAIDLGTGRTAVAVDAGYQHTCAILDNGDLKCWGDDYEGQLGDGGSNTNTNAPSSTAIDLGTGRTMSVSERDLDGDGILNIFDADPFNSSANSSPVWNIPGFQEGSIYTNMTLSAGSHYTCAILDNGDLKCWGYDYHGQLGDGGSNNDTNAPSSTAIDLGTGRTAVAVAAGEYHTCAILDNGDLKCWGYDGYGQLGDGGSNTDTNAPSSTAIDLGTGRAAVAVAVGGSHTCAILDNGDLKCWGYDGYGQLGDGGSNTNTNAPSSTAIDLGTGRTAVAVSVGYYHTCAILDNGDLKCWGRDTSGQLGDGGGNTDTNAPSSTAIDLGTGRTAVAVSAGWQHTCAILDNGDLNCWGTDGKGQLGDGGSNTDTNAPSSTAIDLGTGRTAVAVSAGNQHTCAILDNGDVKCWGDDSFGQLGDGGTNTDTNAPSSTAIDLGTGRTAVAMSDGYFHTCAILDNGDLKCWGYDYYGQLGDGGSNTDTNAPSSTAIDLGTSRTMSVSERDLDGDGILNIFDSTPYTPNFNIDPSNWTLSPNQGPHTGGTEVTMTGNFSAFYEDYQSSTSTQGSLNHTWSDSIISDNDGEAFRDFSIEIDSNDRIHAVFISNSQLKYITKGQGSWSSPYILENFSSSNYGLNSIAVDSNGNPHVAYWDGTYLKYRSPNNGVWNTPTVFSSATSSNAYQNMVIDANDHVHILYYESSTSSLALRTHDGVSWSNSTIDSSTYAAYRSDRASMYIDSNSEVHVVYYRDYGNGDYEFLYSNFDGSAWSNSTINASITNSAGASIVVDSNSIVHVAYGFENDDGLNLVHAQYSGGTWSSNIVDSDQAGSGTSLTMDSDDNLYLFYTAEMAAYEVRFASYDGTNWDRTMFSLNESIQSKVQMLMDSNRNLHVVYNSMENNAGNFEYLFGLSNYVPSSGLNAEFVGYGNTSVTFVNNTTLTFTTPSGPVEGGIVNVTLWNQGGTGYVLNSVYTYLPEEILDADADGIADLNDDCPNDAGNSTLDQVGCPDFDGDGYSDSGDLFPSNPSEWSDTDGDGVGDNADVFPDNANETMDSDGDGIGNNADAFPNDATETSDLDGDGVGDNSDAFPDDANETTDSDGDGVGDNSDSFPNDGNETSDSDGDGVGDNADVFPDNANETADSDNDGLGDNEDEYPFINNFIDSDGDEIPDLFDDFINDPTQWSDYDGDGYGDYSEGNNSDAFINNASQWSDTDGDGYGDNWGNSTWNQTRLFIWPGQFVENAVLADHCPTEFGNSTADGYFGCIDMDGDGIADIYDDLIQDDSEMENQSNATNETGSVDSDGDGVEDLFDLCPNTVLDGYVDIDGCLFDNDGDGVDDLKDACPDTKPDVSVNVNGCAVSDDEGQSFIDSLSSGDQTAVLQTVGVGAVLIALFGFLQTNMVAALLPDSIRWLRVLKGDSKLNKEEIRELEYLKSLVQTYYQDYEMLHEELYQLKSELTARYTNSEIKKVTREKLNTLISDLIAMEAEELNHIAHNDAFFGLGGALSTKERGEYLEQDALMRFDDNVIDIEREFESTQTLSSHPLKEVKGQMNETDGHEYLEHPSGSDSWYYRNHSTGEWAKWDN